MSENQSKPKWSSVLHSLATKSSSTTKPSRLSSLSASLLSTGAKTGNPTLRSGRRSRFRRPSVRPKLTPVVDVDSHLKRMHQRLRRLQVQRFRSFPGGGGVHSRRSHPHFGRRRKMNPNQPATQAQEQLLTPEATPNRKPRRRRRSRRPNTSTYGITSRTQLEMRELMRTEQADLTLLRRENELLKNKLRELQSGSTARSRRRVRMRRRNCGNTGSAWKGADSSAKENDKAGAAATMSSSRDGLSCLDGSDGSNASKLERLSSKVQSCRTELDHCVLERREIECRIERDRNTLRSHVLESRPVLAPDSAESRRIRRLEEELDRVLITLNEVVEIGTKYGNILKRSKQEQRGFDEKLRCIERTVKEKKRDVAELRGRLLQAKNLREKSKIELAHVLDENREHLMAMNTEMDRKVQFVKEKLDMTRKLTQRSDVVRQMESLQNETRLKMRLIGNRFGQRVDGSRRVEENRQLLILERKWRRLMELTGASTQREVVAKFFSSCDTYVTLESIVAEMKKKLRDQSALRSQLQQKLTERTYSSGSNTMRLQEEYATNLRKSNEARKNACERFREMTVLCSELLESFRTVNDRVAASLVMAGGNPTSHAVQSTGSSASTVLPFIMETLESNLQLLVELDAKSEEVRETGSFFVTCATPNLSLTCSQFGLGLENIRVPVCSPKSRKSAESDGASSEDEGDDSAFAESQEPPDREQIKLLSRLAATRGLNEKNWKMARK